MNIAAAWDTDRRRLRLAASMDSLLSRERRRFFFFTYVARGIASAILCHRLVHPSTQHFFLPPSSPCPKLGEDGGRKKCGILTRRSSSFPSAWLGFCWRPSARQEPSLCTRFYS